MNLTNVIFVFVSLLNACAMVAAKALPESEDSKDHRISKRSSTADHNINQRQSRELADLNRRLMIARLIQSIDTSGEAVDFTPSMSSTTTTKLRNSSEFGSGRRRGRKHRQHRRRKNRGGRKKRKGKKSRRGRRGPRSVVDSIAMLVESEYGDEILNAIAAIVNPSTKLAGKVGAAAQLVQKTARKCECSTTG